MWAYYPHHMIKNIYYSETHDTAFHYMTSMIVINMQLRMLSYTAYLSVMCQLLQCSWSTQLELIHLTKLSVIQTAAIDSGLKL